MWTDPEHIKWATELWLLCKGGLACPHAPCSSQIPEWGWKWSQLHTWAASPFGPQVGLGLVCGWECALLRWLQHVPCFVHHALMTVLGSSPVCFAAFMMRALSFHGCWKHQTWSQSTGSHMVPFGPLPGVRVITFCHFPFREDKIGDVKNLKPILPLQSHSRTAPACLGQPHFLYLPYSWALVPAASVISPSLTYFTICCCLRSAFVIYLSFWVIQLPVLHMEGQW